MENPQVTAPLAPPSPANSSPSIPACLASPPSSSTRPSPHIAHGSSYVEVLKGFTHQPNPRPPCTSVIAQRHEHVEHVFDSAMAHPGMDQPFVHGVSSPIVNASPPPLG
ncbi:hypothetical protein Salat_2960100 [Sesamum alatum]|uniref:Uncharacterized protein n=1 Tax=Sesamum alatum TaxID=300844 RepID=A0AAE2C7Y0_9LAMI|nr:hypothetical protein Salat_2960100 [Sesamum alatum]